MVEKVKRTVFSESRRRLCLSRLQPARGLVRYPLCGPYAVLPYGISKDRICYIHGDSSTDDVLICGHNNKFLPKENVVEESDFANQIQQVNDVIKGYYNATRKETQIYMQEHKAFVEQLSSVETIEIIGHSFENTIDDDYFSYLKEKVSPNCKWEISCYSDSDRKNNDTFAQRIGLQNYKSYSLNPLFRITDER